MNSIVATLAAGDDPDAVGVTAGNAGVWVTNLYSNNVTIFSGATNHAIDSVSAQYPIAITSGNGLVWVVDLNTQNVTVFSAASHAEFYTVQVGLNPIGAAFDSANGEVYVANAASANVTNLWGPSDRYTRSIPLGVGPEAIAYDSWNGDLYTANYDYNNVSVISGSLNRVVATVPVGTQPEALGVDSSNGNVYVANGGSSNVSVISGALNTVVATIPVGPGPAGVTYAGATGGYVYVSNAGSDNLSVISDTTNKVVASVPAGDIPTALAYDSLNGDLYAVDYGSDQVSVIAAGFAVNLTETGLPAGTSWSAVFGGAPGYSSAATVAFDALPGTYTYQIDPLPGYTVSPSSGTVTVAGSFLVAVTFSAVTYPVTIAEDGLRGGTTWTVSINGGPHSTSGTSLVFELPNGSYPYSVAGVVGYTINGGSGSVMVDGSPGSVGVGFTSNSTSSPSTQVNVAGYDEGLTIAAALGAIGLGLGAASLLLLRRQRPPPPAGPGAK